ncbi:MAG: PSD1 and planctomycete cytochrome C domain-containing protein [Pirellulales bacterium]|nr:PSD1 and planctomycete cytochrome C domain-containing protein [Pirellulales bacterium]
MRAMLAQLWSGARFIHRLAALLAIIFICQICSAKEPETTANKSDEKELSAADREFFEKEIRPLLQNRCLECHAASAKHENGNLHLDSRAGWQKGGDSGAAIIPGKPEESLLVAAIEHQPDSPEMPPTGKLPAAEIKLLREWVHRGAPDPRTAAPTTTTPPRVIDLAAESQHWAYQPLNQVTPPKIDPQRAPTAIDRFWLDKLQTAGISPALPADRRTLIRRAYLTVIGLPPRMAEITEFEQDTSPDAYEKVIDRLLASPHYGERWGRHWLDLARYAESHGYEQDYDRPTAYPYRDFVIKAFNLDLPYTDFVRWQIAGDELEPTNPLALQATGFLGAGTHATQITANQVEKERYDELDDMVATVGTSMLGLTIGCARCHDHKFDPIPVRDYYQLAATFTTTVRSDQDIVLNPAEYAAQLAEHAAVLEKLKKEQSAYGEKHLQGKFATWLVDPQRPAISSAWQTLNPRAVTASDGVRFDIAASGVVTAHGGNPSFVKYTVELPLPAGKLSAIRLAALADEKLVNKGPGRADNGNFALTNVTAQWLPVPTAVSAGAATPQLLKLANPQATFNQGDNLHVRHTIDADPKSAWAVDPQFGRDHYASFTVLDSPEFAQDGVLKVELDFQNNDRHALGRFAVAIARGPGIPALADVPTAALVVSGEEKLRQAASTGQPVEKLLTAEERAALWDHFCSQDPQWQEFTRRIAEHERNLPKPKTEKCMICSEGVPAIRFHTQGGDFLEKTHLLRRGDPNQKVEEINAGFLRVLCRANTPEELAELEKTWRVAPPADSKLSYRRAALANWLTDVERGAGHLLARVIINRLWQHHFGQGIVATPSDFGKQGSPPSHPELLDYLASELIAGGWRLKPIQRQILLSQAYRQANTYNEPAFAADPENALLWRWTPRRLEAEIIRDSLLSVSGLLDKTQFGPGTLDQKMRRRSIYFTLKRSQLIPLLQLFDAPDTNQGIGKRPVTTVAPQALWLMNSEIVREYAAAVAEGILTESPPTAENVDERITAAYSRIVARVPSATELNASRAFFVKVAGGGDQIATDTNYKKITTDFCQVLLSLNEFVTIE